MIKTLQKLMGGLANFINRHIYIALILIVIISAIAATGIPKIEFQSDLDKMDPQDIPIVKMDNKVSEEFSSGDSTIILLELENNDKSDIIDIRDPKVIEFTSKLKESLIKENIINSVASPSDIFYMGLPTTLEESKSTISSTPGADMFYGIGYDWTILFIKSDAGSDESKIRQLNERIEEIILESGRPLGIKTTVTGNPSLMAVMFNLMVNDAMFTLIIATILIFILLIIIERSLSKSAVIMIPLLVGIEWTLGAMGWFNIPITIATAGLSAMLLGLGVEYSIFLYSRYEEEHRLAKNPSVAIKKALSTTGASTVSSGFTTVIGFGVLTLSTFPVLADMGKSLALGISLILSAVMLVSPVVIKLENKFLKDPCKKEQEEKHDTGFLLSLFESYGKFLSRAPFLVILIMLILTGSMFIGIGMMKNQDIDFDTVLPQNLAELEAFRTIQNERGETESVNLYIEVVPMEFSSLDDARDQEVAEYVDILSQKIRNIEYFDSLTSYTNSEKDFNHNSLFPSFSKRREFYNAHNLASRNYFTTDYSGTLISIEFSNDVFKERAEALRQLKEIISNTKSPYGVKVHILGDMAIKEELNSIMGPDSSRTAIYALIGVFILLLVLSRSIKYTLLPLFTVVGAIIWTLGLLGFTGLPFNSITSSVLSMTIGIGIDFGLQLSMRYRQDRVNLNNKDSMVETLKHTLYPMVITVIAALIGFQAMSLGNLKMMGDLGTTMGYSIISSMIVAVTLVAALILIFDRKNS